ncbi:MAG: hypothetical protein V3S11_00160 [Elusimicrobiota bacterium]
MKTHPDGVALNTEDCPACEKKFKPKLVSAEDRASAVCTTEGCRYTVELFWFGKISGGVN